MDPFALWSLIIGVLLVLMALSGTLLSRLPISTSMLYLAVGVAMGPVLFDLAAPELFGDSVLVERLTEVAVLISLFTSGLKLSPGLSDRRWRLPLRLAFGSMAVTVGLIALAGWAVLGLSPGAAILLGAILAPTDPVLASDVQLEAPEDGDRLRFSLTGEGGMNDGTAFPFVMLGLGLLGLHELGEFGWRWVAVDLVWAVVAGLGIGAAAGTLVGRLVLYLRRRHREATGLDEFLALGLIALAYGAALLASAYGFLAVFAAGVALRRVERIETRKAAGAEAVGTEAVGAEAVGAEALGTTPAGNDAPGSKAGRADPAAGHAVDRGTDGGPDTVMDATSKGDRPPPNSPVPLAELVSGHVDLEEVATHPKHAPAWLALSVLQFNERIERIGEVTVMLLIGALLWSVDLPREALWFVPLLFIVIRPLSVRIGLAGSRTTRTQRRLIGWFGIRGIGSLYYLAYAITHGLTGPEGDMLAGMTLAVIVSSVVAHGVSVTPLMKLYARIGPRTAAG